jgi:hypothetical protein
MNPVVENRLAKLHELHLDVGEHSSFKDGYSATELISWLAGEPYTASPKCLSPWLRAFLQVFNNGLYDGGRQNLKPYLPRCIGTAGDGKDQARSWLAADWVVRVSTPTWLKLAGATETAEELRALPPITDAETTKAGRSVARKACDKASALDKAAIERLTKKYAAAADDADYYALDDAYDFAAAPDAAAAAAYHASDAYADAAAADAKGWTLSEIRKAAKKAAKDAYAAAAAADDAYAAAYVAARAAGAAAAADAKGWTLSEIHKAAKKAAEEKLEPTTAELQKSGFELLERLIDPAVEEAIAASA